MHLLINVLAKVLASLQPLVEEKDRSEYVSLCEQIPLIFTTEQNSTRNHDALFTSLRTMLSSLKTTLACIGSGLEGVIDTLLDALAVFVSSHNQLSSGREKHDAKWLTQVFSSAQLWLIVGLLQSHVLQPQGPVDPAYKQSVKLDYARRQVRPPISLGSFEKKHRKHPVLEWKL